MRPLVDMDTLQIECTNFCHNSCSNCTRFCGNFQKPYFLSFDKFKEAVDSLVDFPNMTGLMGGEVLYHPEFEKFCNYLHSKIPPDHCGLWSCFPEGKEHYREVIVETFGHIFLNDHSRQDVYHQPILVAAKELCQDKKHSMWYLIDHCWLQNSWSASINPNGAFFCEVAASLSLLLDRNCGWKVEPRWWEKTPKDFVRQMEEFCPNCGAAMFLKRRVSTEGIDDISPQMLNTLRFKSPKLKAGKYKVHDLKMDFDTSPKATYKDMDYRTMIADRYGMFLMPNDKKFLTPYLKRGWKPIQEEVSL